MTVLGPKTTKLGLKMIKFEHYTADLRPKWAKLEPKMGKLGPKMGKLGP